MIQVWTMPGLHGGRADDDPLGVMSLVLDEAGYTSVVATNCDQVYHRYLRHGEQLTVRASLLDVTGPKRTALGEGWFVTTRSTWYAGDEPVAAMDFRILKFRPPDRPAPDPASPAATASCGRRSPRTPRSSGPGPRPGNCGSSGARTAARCATRRGRCAPAAAQAGRRRVRRRRRDRRGLQLRGASPPAGAGQDGCPSSSRWWSCRRASGWSASCPAPARTRCGSGCRSGPRSSGSTTT